MKRFEPETTVEPTDDERETIESLLNYPSLERAFAGDIAAGAEKIKQKMRSSVVELERVVRRGAQNEAEKAERVLAAYKTTLQFLEELENRRKNVSDASEKK